MPWCPNCKTEYQDGYTVCSDCGSTLVESLEQAAAGGSGRIHPGCCRFVPG